jgi:hypothetical protein
MGQRDRLPSQFPEGTRYIIEGRNGQVLSEYLRFPDGEHVDLLVDRRRRSKPQLRRARRRSSPPGR